jgi:hypothetical protein
MWPSLIRQSREARFQASKNTFVAVGTAKKYFGVGKVRLSADNRSSKAVVRESVTLTTCIQPENSNLIPKFGDSSLRVARKTCQGLF